MTSYDYDNAELSALKGKTILIFGAATGIGLATVQLAHCKKDGPFAESIAHNL